MADEQRAALVLGARNLGGAVVRQFAAAGWRTAAVARSEESLAPLKDEGTIGIAADAGDLDELAAAVADARERLGRLDAVVNAVSASRAPDDGKPFGGGAVTEATLAGFEGWTVAVAHQAFVFLSASSRVLEPGGALVQVTGGSARRATSGKGLWAAGAAAVRAMTHAAALELRERQIHAALLIVDGIIGSPRTQRMTEKMPPEAIADQDEVARAAVYLAEQSPRALTHELVLTPSGDRWLP